MIILENVNKQYTIKSGFIHKNIQTVDALKHINLTIDKGETIGLIGLNGAGKSTLLKLILGILTPNDGSVKLFGKTPVDHRKLLMKDVGVVFGQRPQLRWDVSPKDAYDLNKEIYKIDTEQYQKNLHYYADKLRVRDFWDRPVRTLSLGQKMRADLLAALLHNPSLLILDEPTIGMDVVSRNVMLELIKELKQQVTILFTSHNLSDVYELCDRFVILNHGQVVIDEKKSVISQRIGFVSIQVTIAESTLNFEPANFSITKANDYEYRIEDIPKEQLKEVLNDLYERNTIEELSIQNNNLEAILNQIEGANV